MKLIQQSQTESDWMPFATRLIVSIAQRPADQRTREGVDTFLGSREILLRLSDAAAVSHDVDFR